VTFYPDNVRLLRVFAGKTQLELAEEISVSEAAVWQFERGREPSETVREALAIVLKVKPEFFSVRMPGELTDQNCNFRKGTSSIERVRRQVLSQGSLFSHVAFHLQYKLKVALPAYDVPRIDASTMAEIEKAADACRDHWKLGDDRPIGNMARVLENAGVMITRLRDEESAKLDAFSHRGLNGAPSFVVLNPAKGSTSRTRFDMAHELAHLVLHEGTALPFKDREAQADHFASAFLLPRKAVLREFRVGRRFDLDHILELKLRWKVSAQAIAYRAYSLGIINAVEFRRIYKMMNARHWLKQEPNEPEHEAPELFRIAIQTLWQRRKIGAPQIADGLNWSIDLFEGVTGLRAPEHPGIHSDGIVSLMDRAPARKHA
jgi:Zn-dependent peptidase ImmA (M78 family)/transcriptional regulator with XRE-family HTH domain